MRSCELSRHLKMVTFDITIKAAYKHAIARDGIPYVYFLVAYGYINYLVLRRMFLF